MGPPRRTARLHRPGGIDRPVYDSLEPLAALCAAAAVTDRIGLLTSVLLGPLRPNHVLLAKQVATLDRLSAGRLVLGLAPGVRQDDFTAGGVDYHHRGAALDALTVTLRACWQDGSLIGPRPGRPGGPPLVFGGTSASTFRRVAACGDGWISGVAGAQDFGAGAQRARQAWTAAGRPGQPRLLACASYGLGPAGARETEKNLRDYYRFLPWLADQAIAAAATTPHQLTDMVTRFQAAGCHELILFPGSPQPGQVDALADALTAGSSPDSCAAKPGGRSTSATRAAWFVREVRDLGYGHRCGCDLGPHRYRARRQGTTGVR